jgi:hypothetical protein
MSRIVDNLIAYRVLSMLVANFEDSDAFKLGIVDANGHALKKAKDLKTEEEKDAYDYLTRLVFNLKRLINKLPGGETKIKSMIAALWLVKEHYRTGSRSTAMLQEKFATLMKLMDNRVSLVEEEITVRRFLSEEGEGAAVGGAPTNNTSGVAGLSKETGGPVIKKKDIKKYQGTVTRRSQLNIPEIKP